MPGNYESLQSELPLNKLRFEPLGFLQFEPMDLSIKAGGTARREMKTAYLPMKNSKAEAVMLLKLLVHGYHPNHLNIFNQVSIIAINCLGNTYSVKGDKTTPQPPDQLGTYGGRFEEEMLYDASTVQKLRSLEEAKKEAVSQLDFE